MPGLSLISSVFGLNVIPRTAMRFPETEPPQAASIFSIMRRTRASLTSTTVSTIRTGAPARRAVDTRARVSFGRQEPP